MTGVVPESGHGIRNDHWISPQTAVGKTQVRGIDEYEALKS